MKTLKNTPAVKLSPRGKGRVTSDLLDDKNRFNRLFPATTKWVPIPETQSIEEARRELLLAPETRPNKKHPQYDVWVEWPVRRVVPDEAKHQRRFFWTCRWKNKNQWVDLWNSGGILYFNKWALLVWHRTEYGWHATLRK